MHNTTFTVPSALSEVHDGYASKMHEQARVTRMAHDIVRGAHHELVLGAQRDLVGEELAEDLVRPVPDEASKQVEDSAHCESDRDGLHSEEIPLGAWTERVDESGGRAAGERDRQYYCRLRRDGERE